MFCFLAALFVSVLLVPSFYVIVSILFDGENISFKASLVMYINSIIIPSIIIMNRIYENQNLLCIVPLIRHTCYELFLR